MPNPPTTVLDTLHATRAELARLRDWADAKFDTDYDRQYIAEALLDGITNVLHALDTAV